MAAPKTVNRRCLLSIAALASTAGSASFAVNAQSVEKACRGKTKPYSRRVAGRTSSSHPTPLTAFDTYARSFGGLSMMERRGGIRRSICQRHQQQAVGTHRSNSLSGYPFESIVFAMANEQLALRHRADRSDVLTVHTKGKQGRCSQHLTFDRMARRATSQVWPQFPTRPAKCNGSGGGCKTILHRTLYH